MTLRTPVKAHATKYGFLAAVHNLVSGLSALLGLHFLSLLKLGKRMR